MQRRHPSHVRRVVPFRVAPLSTSRLASVAIGRILTISGDEVFPFVLAADAQAPTEYRRNGTFQSFDYAVEDTTPFIDGSLRDGWGDGVE
mmetsp:Transcript_55460/g.117920  ORF Transcript_55460/g.117920 Transcript_55460/m.117920 type:complete len:90 (+) Transcript_55460:283-552(+)